jgi:hypothetical protein
MGHVVSLSTMYFFEKTHFLPPLPLPPPLSQHGKVMLFLMSLS